MIKIKLGRNTAVWEGGTWKSESKDFEEMLNYCVNSESLPGYTPNLQEGIYHLVQEVLEGVEILEYAPDKQPKDSGEERIY